MKTIYLDIFSGISGDMFIGAMLDLGVDFNRLEIDLARLRLDGYHVHQSRRQKANIDGVKFDVHLTDHGHGHDHHHPHGHGHDHVHGRTFAQIRQLIQGSDLNEWVKEKSIAVFQRVAVAEGKIHGLPPEQVHFHEVGAVDSIVDIVGGCICLDLLGRPAVRSARPLEGTGTIQCAHGTFPIPAPATLEILRSRQVALAQCEEPNELITPTGAALLAEFAEEFGPLPSMSVEKVGYGLGTRDNKTRPNVLRAVLGERVAAGVAAAGGTRDWESDVIAVLETNLDDINAEILGHFMEKALGAGALDVFHTAIQMKKNRPGTLLTVLCAEADAEKFCEMLLRETSAFGVRRTSAERRKLQREFLTVKIAGGEVVVKIGRLNGVVVQVAPEYESCRGLAEKSGMLLKDVYEAARRAAER